MKRFPKLVLGVVFFSLGGLLFGITSLQFSPIILKEVDLRDVLIAILALFVCLFIGIYWTFERRNQQLSEILDVIDALSQSQYYRRYYGQRYSSMDELGGKVNRLAEKLESKTAHIKWNERQLQTLLDHLMIGVVLLDHTGNIRWANQQALRFLDVANVNDHPYSEIFSSSALRQMLEQVYTHPRALREEITFYYPKQQLLDVNAIPLLNESLQLEQVMLLLYDITEIKRLNKVRSEFVANASHELKTPVTAIQGFAETLLEEGLDNSELTKQFVEIIYKESTRLNRLVQDILQLSKIEQKALPTTEEWIILRDLVDEQVHILAQKLNEKQIDVTIEGEIAPLLCDPIKLSQIILNILVNAVNYTDVHGMIRVFLSEEEQSISISIQDSGIGISESDLDRIFERFYRVDKARSRNTGGTGLGLSIVKNLVDSLYGKITVSSQLGSGSTFTVNLPVKREQ